MATDQNTNINSRYKVLPTTGPQHANASNLSDLSNLSLSKQFQVLPSLINKRAGKLPTARPKPTPSNRFTLRSKSELTEGEKTKATHMTAVAPECSANLDQENARSHESVFLAACPQRLRRSSEKKTKQREPSALAVLRTWNLKSLGPVFTAFGLASSRSASVASSSSLGTFMRAQSGFILSFPRFRRAHPHLPRLAASCRSRSRNSSAKTCMILGTM
mmetsp:Transcript_87707/g.227690  ORF Transcript_87707/g.227690 Transcript_87707/m.227690 type:complete len:218 (+) Transcript_87707:2-655(+)